MLTEKLLQIVDILLEEKRQCLLRQKECEKIINDLSDLPKGSVHVKKRNSREYYYLVTHCTEGKKTIFKYIGSDRDDISITLERIRKNNETRKSLKFLKEDIEIIDKLLSVANKKNQKERMREQPIEPPPQEQTPPNPPSQLPPRAR